MYSLLFQSLLTFLGNTIHSKWNIWHFQEVLIHSCYNLKRKVECRIPLINLHDISNVTRAVLCYSGHIGAHLLCLSNKYYGIFKILIVQLVFFVFLFITTAENNIFVKYTTNTILYTYFPSKITIKRSF